ncbi:unnamed protein product, partial [Adineta ricciae]
MTHATTNGIEISSRFREMVERLQQSRKDNIFDERDLKRWAEQLEQLKENFTSPSSIAVEEIRTSVRCYAQLQDEGMIVIQNNNQYMAHVRGKGEYSRGVHKIQLKIENFNNGFLFFGINSKSTPIQNNSNTTPSSYGWLVGGNKAVYLH